MSWQIAIILHLLASTAFGLVYRRFADRHKDIPKLTNALMYAVFLTPIAVIYAYSTDVVTFSFSSWQWFLLIIAGILFALTNFTAYRANSYIDATQFAIISNLASVFIIILAALLLDEHMTGIQLLGALLLITTAALIMVKDFKARSLVISRWSWVALLSAALMALAITSEKYLLGQMNLSSYMVVGWGLQTISMVVLTGSEWKRLKDLTRNSWMTIGSLGVLRSMQGLTMITALSLADAGLVISSRSYTVVLIFIGSLIFLNEKEHRIRKGIGAILASIGLWLIFS